MKKFALVAVAVLAFTGTAHAQAVTQVIHTVYPQGGTTPAQTPATLNMTAFTCNQTPKIPRPTATQVNPTRIIIDDPANPTTAQCIFTAGVTSDGGLFSLPFGPTVYESTLKNVSVGGTSPESARSNLFTHPGATPNAPTGLIIARLLSRTKTVFGFRRGNVGSGSGRFIYLVGDRRNK